MRVLFGDLVCSEETLGFEVFDSLLQGGHWVLGDLVGGGGVWGCEASAQEIFEVVVVHGCRVVLLVV